MIQRIRIIISAFYFVIFLLNLNSAFSQTILNYNDKSRLTDSTKDSISLCVKMVQYHLDNGRWSKMEVKNFTFNSDNILSEYSVAQVHNDSITSATKIFNRYNEEGRFIGQTGKEWKNGGWIDMKSGCHLEYDGRGNCIKYSDYILEDLKEKIFHMRESTYDNKGNEIEKTSKILKGESFVPYNKATYVVNNRKQLVEQVNLVWKNNEWFPDSKLYFDYDDKGRLKQLSQDNYSNLGWEKRNHHIFTYDESARTCEECFERYMSGRWEKEVRHITYLDAEGNIQKIETLGFSSVSGWQTNLKTIFEYKKVPINKPRLGNDVAENPSQGIPQPEFKLEHNFPNPFNATTQIQFYVPFTAHVSLKVYDILGREVTTLVDEERQQGEYSVMWNGIDVASGVYFYRMVANEFSQVHKMNLVK